MSVNKNKKELNNIEKPIKIGVLHGARRNGGDFLIYKRGRKLLEYFSNNKFNFIWKLRSEPIEGDFDGIILLGGPLLCRKLDLQSRNIIDYIKDKKIPIFCMGLGISGVYTNSYSYENYFLDYGSICFWKYIYKTSKLFSVRDIDSYYILKNYGIDAELTGCPALFDLQSSEKGNKILLKNQEIKKIAVTLPNIIIPTLKSISPLIKILFFLNLLSRKFKDKEIVVFFLHGYRGFNIILKILTNIFGFSTRDVSDESIEQFDFNNFDVHIGTRLHPHIYFLSLNKPSFLFSVDLRTEAFLKTIKTPHNDFTMSGIKNMINILSDKISKNNFEEFNSVPDEIAKLFEVMKKFLNKIILFYEK